MRCARSMACASAAGFHHGSSRNTYSAAVRLSPTPPALRLTRRTLHAGSVLEARDDGLAIARGPVELRAARCPRPRAPAASGRAARGTARTRAPSGRCRAGRRARGSGRRAWRCAGPGARGRAAPGWQAACRSRRRASSTRACRSPAPSARGVAEDLGAEAGAQVLVEGALARRRARRPRSLRGAPADRARPRPWCAAGGRAGARGRGAPRRRGSGSRRSRPSTRRRGRAGRGCRNSTMDQSSPRWFSTGVPESASRCSRAEPAARRGAVSEASFLMACASSRIT